MICNCYRVILLLALLHHLSSPSRVSNFKFNNKIVFKFLDPEKKEDDEKNNFQKQVKKEERLKNKKQQEKNNKNVKKILFFHRHN